MLNGIALTLLTPGVIEALHKNPDLNLNNNIIYTYPKVVYLKIDKENRLKELKNTQKYKVSLSVKNMSNLISQIN